MTGARRDNRTIDPSDPANIVISSHISPPSPITDLHLPEHLHPGETEGEAGDAGEDEEVLLPDHVVDVAVDTA